MYIHQRQDQGMSQSKGGQYNKKTSTQLTSTMNTDLLDLFHPLYVCSDLVSHPNVVNPPKVVRSFQHL